MYIHYTHIYIYTYIYIYFYVVTPPSIHLALVSYVNTMVFSNFRTVDFSALFNNTVSLHKITPGHIFKTGDLLDF